MPFLSIVSITFQNACGLQQTLDSIARQTLRDFEVIVVDGGSMDTTRDVVSAHGSLVTRFTSEPDRGISEALNKGTRAARGELVNYLNAGDRYLDASVLETVHAAYRAAPFEWAYGQMKRIDDAGNIAPGPLAMQRPYAYDDFASGRLLISHQASFFRTELVTRLGAYDESLAQAMDYDLLLRFAARSAPHVLDAPLILYNTSGVSFRRNLEGLLAKHEVRARALQFSSSQRVFDLARTYSRYAVGRARSAGKTALLKSSTGRALLRRLSLLD